MYGSVSQDLAFGFYTVRVELVDKAGNTKSQSVNFELIDLETVPPQVTAITPAYNAQEVALDSPIIVTFSEPLDPNQNFANSMTVQNSQDYQPIEGTYSLNSQGNILTFTPAQPFAGDTSYYVNLQGYLDLAGNEGYYFSSYFSTIDTIAPVLDAQLGLGSNQNFGDLIDLNNARIYSRTPYIYIRCSDNISGINSSSLSFTLDGVSHYLETDCIYKGRYRHPTPLGYGIHTVTAQVSDNNGNSGQISETFEIIPDPSLPFAVEDDTLLLWRLDEFYCSDGCQIPDSGPYKFKVYEYSFAYNTTGRFNSGARNAAIRTNGDTQVLSFGTNPFTVEGWMNYRLDPDNPPSTPIVIWSRGTTSQKEYSLTLLPNGDLQAKVFNTTGTTWETTLSKTTFDVADGQWHSLAMAVERGTAAEQNQLKLYVDGELRMSGQVSEQFRCCQKYGRTFLNR